MILGIMGQKGHGKNTMADAIAKHNDSVRIIHFADKMREVASKVFGIPMMVFLDGSLKESALTTPIEIDSKLQELSKVTGLNLQPRKLKASTPRQLLQMIGTDYVRAVDPRYWVRECLNKAKELENAGSYVIIADTRTKEEWEAVGLIGNVIKVIREDMPRSEDKHITELEMLSLNVDYTFEIEEGDFKRIDTIAKLLAVSDRYLDARLQRYTQHWGISARATSSYLGDYFTTILHKADDASGNQFSRFKFTYADDGSRKLEAMFSGNLRSVPVEEATALMNSMLEQFEATFHHGCNVTTKYAGTDGGELTDVEIWLTNIMPLNPFLPTAEEVDQHGATLQKALDQVNA